MSKRAPLLLLLLASGAVWAQSRTMGMIHQGRGRLALDQLLPKLETAPLDPGLNAQAGLAYHAMGRYADALGYLAYAEGSEIYPQVGVAREAESLRATGQAQAAIALHTERLWQSPDERRQLQVWLNLLQDHRSAGEPQRALDAGYMALSLSPRSATVHAWMAEIHLDQGDVELARESLYMADSLPADPANRLLLARARLAIAEGDLESAQALVSAARENRRWLPDNVAMQCEIFLAQDDPGAVLDLLDKSLVMHRQDPVLLAQRARAFQALGAQADATYAMHQLQLLSHGFPLRPFAVPGLTPD